MDKHLIIADEKIINKIYFIRGHKVMLDRDLAEMYGVETRRLNEQVNRNIERFPQHFMFQLNEQEHDNLMSQNAISRWGGIRKLPLVFTEHGILQLSNVLKSQSALRMSIRIIEVFVKMREILSSNKDILLKLEQIEKKLMKQDERSNKHEQEIRILFEALKQLLTPEPLPRKQVGYKYGEK